MGCRRKAPTPELVKVVAGPAGLVVDPRRGAPGRGAYLHRDRSCAEQALKRGALARSLRVSIGPDEVSNLLRVIEAPEGATEET